MPFSSITIPGIAGWNTKQKESPQSANPPSAGSWRESKDSSAVSETFGIPSIDDPDPFGVHALEQAGLEIKEAGTHSRPTSNVFEFKPSPTSPLFRQSFQSIDGISRQGSIARESFSPRDPKRESKRSMISIDHGTQTADLPSPSSPRVEETKIVQHSPLREEFSSDIDSPEQVKEALDEQTQADLGREEAPVRSEGTSDERIEEDLKDDAIQDQTEEVPGDRHDEVLKLLDVEVSEDEEEFDEDDEDEIFGGPVTIIEEAEPAAVQVVSTSLASPTVSRIKLVSIPRRGPPVLPMRSPLRRRAHPPLEHADASGEHLGVETGDDNSSIYSPSPTKGQFENSSEQPDMSEEHSTPNTELVASNEGPLASENRVDAMENPEPITDSGALSGALSGEPDQQAEKGSEHQASTIQTPIGQLIRAGLDDDSDLEEDTIQIPQRSPMRLSSNSLAGTNVQPNIDAAVPLDMVNGEQLSGAANNIDQNGSTDHGLDRVSSDQSSARSVERVRHSPGLHSLSSDEGRYSRVQSSAPTENANDTSSISDYGEDDMKESASLPSMNATTTKRLSLIPSETKLADTTS